MHGCNVVISTGASPSMSGGGMYLDGLEVTDAAKAQSRDTTWIMHISSSVIDTKSQGQKVRSGRPELDAFCT